MKTDIILAGVGGQGILSIATILAAAALDQDLYIKQAEVHGMSQRGGDVQSHLRLSSTPIASDLIETGRADLIISLEPLEALRYVQCLGPEGTVVTNTVPFKNIDNYPEVDAVLIDLADRAPRLVAFDVDALAAKAASPRAANIVLLGAASPFIDINADNIEHAIAKVFAAKGQSVIDMNIAAFRAGRNQALNHQL